MKFFVDTAMIDEIRQAVDLGICDGVTTNPSLVAMTGKTLAAVVNEITAVVDGPISVEATAMDYEGMLREAREIAAIHPNIVVKIPMTRDGIKTVSKVSAEGIKTNVTLVFSATQALLAAKAGATYVSPFVGRLDDVSAVGMEVIQQIQMIYGNYDFDTEVLVASVRHPIHVLEAAQMGADVATIPFAVLDKLFNHPLTDIGIEKFLADWKKVPKS
ncbi:MAG: fructose-6-phosphate aldolase [Pseudomonadota bacterium]